MKLAELRAALVTALQPLGHPVFDEPLRQIEAELPVIRFLLMPVLMTTAAAGAHTDRSILVDVSYITEVRPSYAALYDMLERIDAALRPTLKVPVEGDKPRYLTIQSAEMRITDDIAHYLFTLSFTQAETRSGGIADLMQELILSLEVTSCPP